MGIRTTAKIGLALVALAACGPIDDAGIASDVERELEWGSEYARELVLGTGREATPAQAIAVGYLERHRLGLGSPFRLIEYSLQDPRLERPDRERLAWALLARTLAGAGHRVDPHALAAGGDVERATRHLELVEGAVRGSADPDGGVLAVRLAYAMAEAESEVSPALRDGVARAAALIRDRVEAARDARRLLRAAGSHTDPLALLTVWRVERRFEVERPATPGQAADVERDAIALAPRLLASVREVPSRPRVGPVQPARERQQVTLLSSEAARVLAVESALYDAPPQTPVTVAVRARARSAAGSDAALRHFVDQAVNEERLAAEYALLGHTAGLAPAARRSLLDAAVGLRAYAQERPWFPGFDGPAKRDLEDRYGLASIEFDPATPPHWRPYYRRMLARALGDLHRVLPSLDVRGLNVRFAERDGSTGTLAVHDPSTRTVFIPARTGAGTVAHEIAHDLDWQTALKRYRVRGDYGTDRAVRLSDERLARVLRGLSTAALVPPPNYDRHESRPAEVFARSVDWFVAVALAREGRLNGYLSSVQDDILTGYGTVTPPDVTGGAGQALMALLDEVAPVYPETRRWFLGSFGRQRAPTAYDLARRIVEAPLAPGDTVELGDTRTDSTADTPADSTAGAPTARGPALARVAEAMASLDRLEGVRDTALARIEGGCQAVAYDNGAGDAWRRLVRMATEARARGVVLEAAAEVAGADGREWTAARLEGRVRDPAPDPMLVAALGGLVERVLTIGEPAPEHAPLEAPTPAPECGPRPFMAE